MGTYKKELYKQSSFTLGIADSRKTRATISALITGLTDARSQLRQATFDAFGQYGGIHPDDSNLPLQTVQSVFLPPNKAVVLMNYGQEPDDPGYLGGVSTFVASELAVGLVSDTEYGTASDGFATKEQLIDKPAMSLFAYGKGTASPLSTVYSRIGQVNSDTVTWSGHNIPAGVVRFDGFTQRVTVISGSTEFTWRYQFSMKPSRWIKYLPNFAGATQIQQNLYGSAAFSNQFPTS